MKVKEKLPENIHVKIAKEKFFFFKLTLFQCRYFKQPRNQSHSH